MPDSPTKVTITPAHLNGVTGHGDLLSQSLAQQVKAAGFDNPFTHPPAFPPLEFQGDAPENAGDDLADLIAQLPGFDHPDLGALKLWALDSVTTLARMDKKQIATFCAHLCEWGIPAAWVRTDLRPAITEAQATAGSTDTDTGGGGKTWTHYVAAASAMGYSFRLNDLSDTIETNGERWTDVHEAIILSQLHAIDMKNVDVARRAFTTAAAQKRFHPVKEYLAGLTWGGEDHIGALSMYFSDQHEPITYADGTQKTVFHAFFSRWLIGAVGKVYNPSDCQNPMLILAGDQDAGKSYFAKWICPIPGLHFEGPIRPDDKDFLAYLTTKWIWEVGELGTTIRKADREALKEFLTKQDATYRPAYGRHALCKPALASFIGTVNPTGPMLSDPTGHRRFWPVNLAALNWDYIKDIDRNQVWAQAYMLYQAGEPWRLSIEERKVHAAIVETYEVEDVLVGYVQEYFRIEPENTNLFLTTTEIISILRKPEGADLKGSEKALSMNLAAALTSLRLVRKKMYVTSEKAQRWGYIGIGRRL